MNHELIRPEPWQTCTCLGQWHYDRGIYERKAYKPAKQVIQRLLDIISKNGNLLLSVPQRGDGMRLTLPPPGPGAFVPVLRVEGSGIA
ncbi:hypothetical protein ASE13_09995 [Sphingomonas sp. Root241]|nr:hypothetical protein ASE13_09995 [Sphingomonas sp. Root241]